MKISKFAFAAMIAALAVWTSNAQIIPGGYYQFERINFSLVVEQQGPTCSHNVFDSLWTGKAMRMGNKELLQFLGEAFHQQWPEGAQLALLRDIRDGYPIFPEIYILDKTGHQVWSGNWGYYLNETNYAYFRVWLDYPVKAGKSEYKWPMETYNVVQSRMISFELYRTEDDPSVFTDLVIQGLDKEKYQSYLDYSQYSSGLYISDGARLSADGPMNGIWTVVGGSVTIYGKWHNQF